MRMCACRGTAGFAHVSCLAEQTKILREEAEYNNLDDEALDSRWARWYSCSLCEQDYHGVVLCALGWACWKTYLGRPERDQVRGMAMTVLGNSLSSAQRHEDALAVREAELAMERRVGASERDILSVQANLSNTYASLGRFEEALRMRQEVYLGHLECFGEEDRGTIVSATNYASCLIDVKDFEEAKRLLRKTMAASRRVLGMSHEFTFNATTIYVEVIYKDTRTTLHDLREGVTMFEETEQTARRVLGGAHPDVRVMEVCLRRARETLRDREEASSLCEAMAAMAPPEKE